MRTIKKCAAMLMALAVWTVHAQTVPSESNYNADIAWEAVYTSGPSGKVNRGMVDSQGHCIAVSMPELSKPMAPMASKCGPSPSTDGWALGCVKWMEMDILTTSFLEGLGAVKSVG